jgi:branched-chain amino acid aminotransferase
VAVRQAFVDGGSDSPWAAGAAYVDGKLSPVGEARIPLTDWGYRRSDVTYDVVSVWNGAFFRLEDHIRRFRASMSALRLSPTESDADIRDILFDLVRRTGLRQAYVAIDCLRGRPPPGTAYHPANARCYLAAFAVPYVWLMSPEIVARGAHLIVASTPRIPAACIDPKIKNFHWGDMTQALFEARDRDADNPVLLDMDGNVTEGPGFNIFTVTNGVVATPDHGILEGITRLSIIELCREFGIPCELRPLPVKELRQADEIFVSSTAGGVIGVTRLDGRILGNDRPGQITSRLHDAYWSKRAEGWHADPIDYAR